MIIGKKAERFLISLLGILLLLSIIPSTVYAEASLWTDAGTYIYPDNYNYFVITDSGNVGIGTSTPAYSLEIQGELYVADVVIKELSNEGDGDDVLVRSTRANKYTAFLLSPNGDPTTYHRASFAVFMNDADADPYNLEYLVLQSAGGDFPPHFSLDTGYMGTGTSQLPLTIRTGKLGINHPKGELPDYDVDIMSSGESNTVFNIDASTDSSRFVIRESINNDLFMRAYNAAGTEYLRINPTSGADSFINTDGNVGIGTANPNSKLQVTNGDIYVETIGSGIILRSPDGSCFRVTVNNDGSFASASVTCP